MWDPTAEPPHTYEQLLKTMAEFRAIYGPGTAADQGLFTVRLIINDHAAPDQVFVMPEAHGQDLLLRWVLSDVPLTEQQDQELRKFVVIAARITWTELMAQMQVEMPDITELEVLELCVLRTKQALVEAAKQKRRGMQ